jgi:dTDP-4-amino-4,6-dideoxygalactose transaminase
MRSQFLPYCLPLIGDEEITEVVDSLRAGWVTTGPKVKRFEDDFAAYIGTRHAIAVNSCTAALQIALTALHIGSSDEVIVPTLTFCATANVVVHCGATPVIVDVDSNFNISLAAVKAALSPCTRAIIPVHYAGLSCELDELHSLADPLGIEVIEDAAHAAGSEYRGRKIGTHSRAVAFSFYATKNMTTGEGGMITTSDDQLAARMRLLALHGMSRDAWKRYTQAGSWYYEVLEAGYKNNMTDIQASLGIHQLRRLESFIARRQEIALAYDKAFSHMPEIILPPRLPDRNHVFHLYPIRLAPEALCLDRTQFMDELRNRNIGTSVHFIPLHRHPFFRDRYACRPEQFAQAEEIYAGLLSLPLYPLMTDRDVADVINAVRDVVMANRQPNPLTQKGASYVAVSA